MTNRSKLRETIMTIIYQITLYKKNNMEYNVDDVIKENLEIDNKYVRDIVNGVLENIDNIDKIINYNNTKIEELYNTKGIIRNKLKINASINNAIIFKQIQKEYGSFSKYLLSFTDKYPIHETGLTTSQLSDFISQDLIKKGMKFTGSTIIYSYLQAIGLINSHEKECYLHQN